MFHGTFSPGLLYRKQLRHGAPGHTWLPSLPNILPGSSGQTADRPSWKVEDLSFCWKRQQRKKNNIGDEERAVTFPFKEVFDRHWNLSDAGLYPIFKKNLWFSLDESHYNCKYQVRKISKVSVIQCKFNWVSIKSPSQPFSGEELCIKRHKNARLIRTQALKSNYDNFHNFLNGFFCMLITVSSQRGYLTTKSTQWIWTKQYSQINLTSYW